MLPDHLLLRDVEVAGRTTTVVVAGGRVVAVGAAPDLGRPALVVDGHGGALIPGLHDHHTHLMATAARSRSVSVGPPAVCSPPDLVRALVEADQTMPAGTWIRAIDYHHSVAGDLDRCSIDAMVSGRPVRVQDRSGARWTCNTVAVAALGLDHLDRPGIERDAAGRATGRVHRGDAWLRALLPDLGPPDLGALGRRLAAWGVTGVTDATPHTSADELVPLAEAAASGALPQRVVAMGGVELASHPFPAPLGRGPVKVVIDDGGDYPCVESLGAAFGAAHAAGRPVAVHCVSRVALVLALAAWDDVHPVPGDRVEHGAVIPPELVVELARHRLTVITQPSFVATRGDDYLADVDRADLPSLYRCASLVEAGVGVAGSTDAPYGPADPWRAVAAARDRATERGAVVGAGERLSPQQALALFLGSPADPGGPCRAVRAGVVADLCLLHVPLAEALHRPSADHVRLTLRAGRVVFGDPGAAP